MLSKSRYLAGLQCAKRLWIETRERRSLPPVDDATQAMFDQGHEVGRLAQRLFPGGLELDRRVRALSLLVRDTEKALRQRVPLYEGAFARSFEGGGGACRVDLVVPAPDGAWDLYEVKSSTSVKEVNLDDVAFQSWVVRGAGVPLRRAHVVHLDSAGVESASPGAGHEGDEIYGREDHRGVEGGGGRSKDEGAVPTARDLRGHVLQLEGEVCRHDGSEARRLKELEAENTNLKRLLADAELDKAALKDLLGRKW